MSSQVIRFLIAVLAATVAAVIFAVATLPLSQYLLSGNSEIDSVSTYADWVFYTTPFALLVGGTLAFPACLIVGSIMIWLERRHNRWRSVMYWMFAGLIAACPAVMQIKHNQPLFPDRLAIAIWLLAAGIAGALTFRAIWHRQYP